MSLRDVNLKVRFSGAQAKQELGELSKAEQHLVMMAREMMKSLDSGAQQAARSYSTVGTAAETAGRKTKDFYQRLKDEGAGAIAGNMLAVLGLTAAVGGFVRSSMETFGRFQRYEKVLETALGDPTDAAQTLQQVKDFAASTPYTVDELTESMNGFINRGLKPSTQQLTAFGDLAASQGKSFAQLKEAMLDISNSERWKELGITSQKVGDRVRLTFKGTTLEAAHTVEGVASLIEQFGQMEGVGGMMANMMDTWEGKMSNLQDSMDTLKFSFGQFIFESAKPLLDWFTDGQAGLDRLKTGLIFMAAFVLPMVAASGYAMLAPFLPFIAIAAAVAAYATMLYLIFEDLYTFAVGGKSMFGDFLESMGFSPESIALIRGVFSDIVEGFGMIWDFVQPFLPELLKVLAVVVAVGAAFISIPIAIVSGLAMGIAWIVKNAGRIKDALLAPYIWVWNQVKRIGPMIMDAIFPWRLLVFAFGQMKEWFASIDWKGMLPDWMAGALNRLGGEQPVEGRAVGGHASAGNIYRVNEHRTELFQPNTDGKIIPLSSGASVGGGTVNIGPIYVTASDPAEAGEKFVEKVGDAIQMLFPGWSVQMGVAGES